MKNKYLFFSLTILVSLLVGLKLFNPLTVFAQVCPGPNNEDTCTRTQTGCNAASSSCQNGYCQYTWECDCYGGSWSSWSSCVGGYQTRECSGIGGYQIQKCGGGGGGQADTQYGPSCTGNYVVDYTQPVSSMCGLPTKDVNYVPGNAQRQEGCCQTVTEPDIVEEKCEWKKGEWTCKNIKYPGETYCAKYTWTTYACKLNCDPNAWGAWSACNVSCGGGTQTRTNACGTLEGRTCNTQSCQGPWWQVKDGDITTNGDIISRLPSGKYLNLAGSGGFPGIPVYGDQIGVAPGTISTTLWNANTTTSLPRVFDYSYFKNLIPETIVFNDIGKLTTGVGATTDASGYEWYKITGNLDTVGNIDFGSRKVILFVDGPPDGEAGLLNINGNINLTDNSGFFVVFVSGKINIAGTVTSLEGIYDSGGSFSTGVGSSQLLVRGSVVSYGGITMQRDLTDDSATPAEFFEFAPDQIMLFPEKLMYRRTKWAEVAS